MVILSRGFVPRTMTFISGLTHDIAVIGNFADAGSGFSFGSNSVSISQVYTLGIQFSSNNYSLIFSGRSSTNSIISNFDGLSVYLTSTFVPSQS